MRISLTEALRRGFISKKEYSEFCKERTKQRHTVNSKAPGLLFFPIEGTTPQEKLWRAICVRWPRRAKWECENLVPGRRFRADIAFVDNGDKLIIEVEGWVFHGKYLDDFKGDRNRRNMFSVLGYCTLHFYTGEILKDIESVLETIESALNNQASTPNK